MNYPEVTLGELADGKGSFVDGPFGSNLKASEYVDAGVPVMRLQNIRPNEYLPKDVKYITQKKADSLSRHNYKSGDVVIAKLGAVGTACIVPDYCNEGIIVADVVRFRGDKTRINHQYLCDFLNSPEGQDRVLRLSKGTTRLRTNLTDLKTIEIPLLPLDDQKRIAYVLRKVEGAIAQRKQHLQQLDDLLKSVFLEMFGDPVRNEKGWTMLTGKEYSTQLTVGVVVKPASYYVEEGVIALRSLNIKPNRIELDNLVFFSEQANEGPLAKSILHAGDVVIVRTGKTGTAAVIPRELDGANCIDLILVRPDIGVLNPYYLSSLLNSERGMALVASREVGGIQKHFNVGAMNRIPFPIPPIELQDQFATIVEKVEGIKILYQQSLTDLETLYGALSQKAFKGELDLSRVPLPSEDTDATAAEPSETSEPPPLLTETFNSLQVPLPSEDTDTIAAEPPETSEPPPTTEPFNLPAPSDLISLNSAEGRHALMNQWLEVWLAYFNNAPFSPQLFIEAAQQRLVELADEEDLPEWSIAEYNSVQAWVFGALGDQHLTQTYDDVKNCVQLHAASSR
ncbi:restriction endonuclease subunit S [Sphaerothrix gracilis]|uniref:restriction endonuclease subunit S n=1 Tax=Sphaerothrix gracilis TaxID=3151835 RepID=UPI0031FC60F2